MDRGSGQELAPHLAGADGPNRLVSKHHIVPVSDAVCNAAELAFQDIIHLHSISRSQRRQPTSKIVPSAKIRHARHHLCLSKQQMAHLKDSISRLQQQSF